MKSCIYLQCLAAVDVDFAHLPDDELSCFRLHVVDLCLVLAIGKLLDAQKIKYVQNFSLSSVLRRLR